MSYKPGPPLPTKEYKLKEQIKLLDQRMRVEKKQCWDEIELLKHENVHLSRLVENLIDENNLFRRRLHLPEFGDSVAPLLRAPLLRAASLEYEPEKILHF